MIDLDSKDGRQGVAAWNKLIGTYGPVSAPKVHTPSGGLHIYFRQPPGAPVIRCARGDLHRHIDVKGFGGYVLAPGAVIETGMYRLVSGNLLSIPDVPPWLFLLLLPRPEPKCFVAGVRSGLDAKEEDAKRVSRAAE